MFGASYRRLWWGKDKDLKLLQLPSDNGLGKKVTVDQSLGS